MGIVWGGMAAIWVESAMGLKGAWLGKGRSHLVAPAQLPPSLSAENQAKQVDVMSVSMIGAGLVSVVLLGLLVLVVVLMTCYHRRKTKRITKK